MSTLQNTPRKSALRVTSDNFRYRKQLARECSAGNRDGAPSCISSRFRVITSGPPADVRAQAVAIALPRRLAENERKMHEAYPGTPTIAVRWNAQ